MNVVTSIEGEKIILRAMKALPGKMQRKVYRAAINRAGTPVLKKARAMTSSKTVKKALTKRARSNAKQGEFDSIIGVRPGVFRSKRIAHRKGGREYFPDEAVRFFRFLELGTKYHAARPFLKPALAASRASASSELSSQVFRGLERVVNSG